MNAVRMLSSRVARKGPEIADAPVVDRSGTRPPGNLLGGPLWLTAIGAGLLYACLSQLIVEVTSFGTSVGAIFWPGAGVTSAVLLRLRSRQWPAVIAAVAAAEFGLDVVGGFGVVAALGWAVANTAEAALGAWLYRRRGRMTVALQEIRSLLRFVGCSVIAGPALGATIGTLWATLVVGDSVWPRLPRWFVGDAIGVLVIAPALLGLRGRGMGSASIHVRLWWALGLVAVTGVGLGPWRITSAWGLPFLVLACLVLSSLWQGHGWAAGGILLVASVVEIMTALGVGPFATEGAFEGLVVAQMFVAACAFSALLVAALTSDLLTRDTVERALREQALHDQLTGLANRRLIDERFQQAIGRARRNGEVVGMGIIDLDRFKTVNDRFGHAAGDAVLVETARRMLSEVRGQDTVARLGGDEFAVLLDGIDDPALADGIAERLAASLSRPVAWEGHELAVTASIGMVVSERDDETLAALAARADEIMYRVKGSRPRS